MTAADTKFLAAFIGLMFLIMIAASASYTVSRSDRNKKKQEQKPASEREEPTENHQAGRPTSQTTDIQKDSEDDHRDRDQEGFQGRQLRIATGLNIITLVAGLVALWGLYILKGTLDTTKQAVKVAQENLEVSERPWIEVIATPITPLTFDNAGGHITVEFRLKNYGKSPATYVFAVTKFMSTWNPFDALDYQQKQCAQIRATETKKIPEGKEFGTTIFPNSIPRVDTAILQLDEADIVASEKTMSEITHFPSTTIEPQIVGCYVYRFGERLYT